MSIDKKVHDGQVVMCQSPCGCVCLSVCSVHTCSTYSRRQVPRCSCEAADPDLWNRTVDKRLVSRCPSSSSQYPSHVMLILQFCHRNCNYGIYNAPSILLDRCCITMLNSDVPNSISQSGRADECWVFVWMMLSITVAWVLSMAVYYKPLTLQPRRLCCRYVNMSVEHWDRSSVGLIKTTSTVNT